MRPTLHRGMGADAVSEEEAAEAAALTTIPGVGTALAIASGIMSLSEGIKARQRAAAEAVQQIWPLLAPEEQKEEQRRAFVSWHADVFKRSQRNRELRQYREHLIGKYAPVTGERDTLVDIITMRSAQKGWTGAFPNHGKTMPYPDLAGLRKGVPPLSQELAEFREKGTLDEQRNLRTRIEQASADEMRNIAMSLMRAGIIESGEVDLAAKTLNVVAKVGLDKYESSKALFSQSQIALMEKILPVLDEQTLTAARAAGEQQAVAEDAAKDAAAKIAAEAVVDGSIGAAEAVPAAEAVLKQASGQELSSEEAALVGRVAPPAKKGSAAKFAIPAAIAVGAALLLRG